MRKIDCALLQNLALSLHRLPACSSVQTCSYTTNMQECVNNRGLHCSFFALLPFGALQPGWWVVHRDGTLFEEHVAFPLHSQDSPICGRGQATFAKQWTPQLENLCLVAILIQEFRGGLGLQGRVQMPRTLEGFGLRI